MQHPNIVGVKEMVVEDIEDGEDPKVPEILFELFRIRFVCYNIYVSCFSHDAMLNRMMMKMQTSARFAFTWSWISGSMN